MLTGAEIRDHWNVVQISSSDYRKVVANMVDRTSAVKAEQIWMQRWILCPEEMTRRTRMREAVLIGTRKPK